MCTGTSKRQQLIKVLPEKILPKIFYNDKFGQIPLRSIALTGRVCEINT